MTKLLAAAQASPACSLADTRRPAPCSLLSSSRRRSSSEARPARAPARVKSAMPQRAQRHVVSSSEGAGGCGQPPTNVDPVETRTINISPIPSSADTQPARATCWHHHPRKGCPTCALLNTLFAWGSGSAHTEQETGSEQQQPTCPSREAGTAPHCLTELPPSGVRRNPTRDGSSPRVVGL